MISEQQDCCDAGLVSDFDGSELSRPGISVPGVRIQILQVPDCPRAVGLRGVVARCLSLSGVGAVVEVIEGPYPSPTLLINGEDVTRRAVEQVPSCRLDLPAEEQILGALNAAARHALAVTAQSGPESREAIS